MTALVAQMTLDEKAALTAGADLWSTVGVARLGIPPVRLTDGPNGARGAGLGSLVPSSTCTPCGLALAASWDVGLLERVGSLIGREARARGCRVLLAPTVNIVRSPLAGRNFECYGEDPLLSGRVAAAFVRGVEREGVIATVKHFVGNEAETERYWSSSVIDERALREIYLRPFEIAVREGGALAVMTAYNRVNGRWVSERRDLVTDVLRDEWGFDGIVMTDWFAVAGTVESALAGVDLEMPGPARAYGAALADAVRAGALDEAVVDSMITRLLTTFDRVGALDAPTPDANGDAPPQQTDADRGLAREAAAAGMVLLRNDGVLPIDPVALRRVAVIGPNAAVAQIMGGGSSRVTPHRLVAPLDALRDALEPGVEVVFEQGCVADETARPLPLTLTVAVFAGHEPNGEPVSVLRSLDARLVLVGPPDGVEPGAPWSARATGSYVPRTTGRHELTLSQSGRARVFVDGALVLDGVDDPMPPGGSDFFGFGSQERTAFVDFDAGRAVEIVLEYHSDGAEGIYGVKLGCRMPNPPDALDRAVAAARAADVAIVVVGTNDDWETEGRDRATMHLPGTQDELIRAVAQANPRTVVVVKAASPVAMDWADDAAAVLQCWFGGEEMAAALADVMTGVREPSGRLPVTIPLRVEHNPSYGNFPGENGEVRYGEGVLVGYRWYEARALPVRFAFGHGLGYTTFELGAPQLSTVAIGVDALARGETIVVDVPVTNRGERRGSEVVQCYVAPQRARLVRPPKELVAFAKVVAGPGETVTARLWLDRRAFSYWDPGWPDHDEVQARASNAVLLGSATPPEPRERGWQLDPGAYDVCIGRASDDIAHRVRVELLPPEV